ncbi:MAG: LolA family protein [Fibrobacterota bacterium]
MPLSKNLSSLILVLLVSAVFSADPDKYLAAYNRAYESLKSVEADFKVETNIMLTGENSVQKGKFIFMKPDMFRVDLKKLKIVSDGVNYWQYSVKNNQVVINDVADVSSSLLPTEILYDYSRKYNASNMGTVSISGEKTHKLRLQRKDGQKSSVRTTVYLSVNSNLPVKIESLDSDGNLTSYYFRNYALNKEYAPGLFIFKIPSECEIIDMRE